MDCPFFFIFSYSFHSYSSTSSCSFYYRIILLFFLFCLLFLSFFSFLSFVSTFFSIFFPVRKRQIRTDVMSTSHPNFLNFFSLPSKYRTSHFFSVILSLTLRDQPPQLPPLPLAPLLFYLSHELFLQHSPSTPFPSQPHLPPTLIPYSPLSFIPHLLHSFPTPIPVPCHCPAFSSPLLQVLLWTQSALSFLLNNQFAISLSNGSIVPSQMGKATTASGEWSEIVC
jgi:hypothetical protein